MYVYMYTHGYIDSITCVYSNIVYSYVWMFVCLWIYMSCILGSTVVEIHKHRHTHTHKHTNTHTNTRVNVSDDPSKRSGLCF